MNSRGAVLVTGASTGIGRSTTLYLERLGFRVFAGVRREEDARALVDAAVGGVRPVWLDVTSAEDIRRTRIAILEEVGDGGIQGLINNAGIAVAGPLEEISDDDLRRQLEVNVIGQLAVTRAMLPMLRAGRGRIVNMGSISGRLAYPFVGAYAASKFALEAITDALRLELEPWGIEVSIVEPGAVDTPIWRKSQDDYDDRMQRVPRSRSRLYSEGRHRFERAAQRLASSGIAPDHVAHAVALALTSSRPRTRYVPGRTAWLQALMARFLPDRLRDRLLLSYLGLKGLRGSRADLAAARNDG